MRVPARCNKRACQARRNLSKRPEEYKYWPKCHLPDCGGKMYVDEYRLRKGPHDKAPPCKDTLCQHQRATGTFVPFHRVDNVGCSGYAQYVTDRNNRERSVHSPIPINDWIPF